MHVYKKAGKRIEFPGHAYYLTGLIKDEKIKENSDYQINACKAVKNSTTLKYLGLKVSYGLRLRLDAWI